MRVKFIPLGTGTDTHAGETILDAARRAAAPLANSCGAVGVCGRCRVKVVSGGEQLAPATTIEMRVSQRHGFDSDERLACQAVVLGECAVTTTYWGS